MVGRDNPYRRYAHFGSISQQCRRVGLTRPPMNSPSHSDNELLVSVTYCVYGEEFTMTYLRSELIYRGNDNDNKKASLLFYRWFLYDRLII